MPCRGIRGATTASENTPEAIMEATQELLRAIAAANNVQLEDIASAIFTVTPDLNAAFAPRARARDGLEQCAAVERRGGRVADRPAPVRPGAHPLEHRAPSV